MDNAYRSDLDVPGLAAPELYERLTELVEDQEGIKGGFRTTHIGNTYLLDTGERLWMRRGEANGCFSLSLSACSIIENATAEAGYPVHFEPCGEIRPGVLRWQLVEDRDKKPLYPAFRGDKRIETLVLDIELRPWGDENTRVVIECTREGAQHALRLLRQAHPIMNEALTKLLRCLRGEDLVDAIPNKKYREMVMEWRTGATGKRLGELFQMTPKGANNRICKLRAQYGALAVPYRRRSKRTS